MVQKRDIGVHQGGIGYTMEVVVHQGGRGTIGRLHVVLHGEVVVKFFSTWMGDPTRLVMLEQVIKVIREQDLLTNACVTGDVLMTGLKQLQVHLVCTYIASHTPDPFLWVDCHMCGLTTGHSMSHVCVCVCVNAVFMCRYLKASKLFTITEVSFTVLALMQL